jgi:hypothetical protein
MERRLTTIRDVVGEDEQLNYGIDKDTKKCDNLLECANYLIHLYNRTGHKYELTRTKIGKLLSILAFRYAREKIKLFQCSIFKWPNSGTIIRELNQYTNIYSYYVGLCQPEIKVISKKELKKRADLTKSFQEYPNLSDKVKKDIEEVFLNFAAYPSYELSKLLNPIVEHEGVCHGDIVDLEAIAQLDLKKFPDNKVLNYIFNR